LHDQDSSAAAAAHTRDAPVIATAPIKAAAASAPRCVFACLVASPASGNSEIKETANVDAKKQTRTANVRGAAAARRRRREI